MIIDCHAHLMPQSWFHPKSPKSIFDLDGLFKEQDEVRGRYHGVRQQLDTLAGRR